MKRDDMPQAVPFLDLMEDYDQEWVVQERTPGA